MKEWERQKEELKNTNKNRRKKIRRKFSRNRPVEFPDGLCGGGGGFSRAAGMWRFSRLRRKSGEKENGVGGCVELSAFPHMVPNQALAAFRR